MDRKRSISTGIRWLILISIVVVIPFVLASNDVKSQGEQTDQSTEPIAYIGHGAVFDANGNEIQVTLEFIETAQGYYQDALLDQADENQSASFEQKKNRLFDGKQWDERSELYAKLVLIEWLFKEVNPQDNPGLLGKLNLLEGKLVSPTFQTDPSASVVKASPFELPQELEELLFEEGITGSEVENFSFSPTSFGGDDYIDECRAAGVPIPPDWGVFAADNWVSQGALSDAQEFISMSLIAEIYTYKSVSPEGVCFALPRSRNLPPPDDKIALLGIICLGKASSNACFWDNQADTDGDGIFEGAFLVDKGTVVPLNQFAGGADLATADAGGVCTDCHAGENPYIRHPSTPLGPPALDSLPVFANNWYRPLVGPRWPQNNGPSNLLDSIPSKGMCTSCH